MKLPKRKMYGGHGKKTTKHQISIFNNLFPDVILIPNKGKFFNVLLIAQILHFPPPR